MKKYFVLLVLLFYLLVSCEKEAISKVHVQGTVISFYDSSLVIPNATVYLHRGQDRVLIDSTKSDSKGNYRMEFTPEVNIMFGVTAKHEKYFESSKNYFYTSTNLSKDNLKIAAYPKSYIRVRVRDTSLANIGYVGVRLNHTAYADFKLVYGYPIKDTTVIVEGYYRTQNFGWGFLYPNNVWGFPEKVIKFNPSTPLDTFNLEIKF